MTADRYGFSFGGVENVPKLMVHFKWVNCIVCELYLSQAVIFKVGCLLLIG